VNVYTYSDIVSKVILQRAEFIYKIERVTLSSNESRLMQSHAEYGISETSFEKLRKEIKTNDRIGMDE